MRFISLLAYSSGGCNEDFHTGCPHSGCGSYRRDSLDPEQGLQEWLPLVVRSDIYGTSRKNK
jgi:hypothetical protein